MADPTLIIDVEPDWKETPEVAYSFATVLQGTPRFLEQRRPLLETPTRTVTCKFVLESEKAQKLLNTLLSGAPQLCCTPIYSEPIFAAAITQGASAITAETDLAYLWNTKNCDYLILLDYITGASEMLKVTSVTGQVVALAAAIVGVWVAAQTVIYPGIASAIKEVKKLDHSSRVASFGAQFEEITIGEEATKVWVGLEEQVCINPFPRGVWLERLPLDPVDAWWSPVCANSSLSRIYASKVDSILGNNLLYRSNDFGSTWTYLGSSKWFHRMEANFDGSRVLVGTSTDYYETVGGLYLSTNYGASFTNISPNSHKRWPCIAINPAGDIIIAGSNTNSPQGRLFKSINSGSSWTELRPMGDVSKTWSRCACSDNGSVIMAGEAGNLHVSIDGGVTWNLRLSSGYLWGGFSCSADGSIQYAASGDSGRIFRSTNFGSDWIQRNPDGNVDRTWRTPIVCTPTGASVAVAATAGYLYKSSNYGDSWVAHNPGVISPFWNSLHIGSNDDLLICADYTNGGIFFFFVY